MGNICCGSKEEKAKASALDGTSTDQDSLGDQHQQQHITGISSNSAGVAGADQSAHSFSQQAHGSAAGGVGGAAPIVVDQQQQSNQEPQDEGLNKALREEQARLELIVQATGRRMVAVRSTRGSTGYYDQGFAAALAQHLEQTTEFPPSLPQQLPTTCYRKKADDGGGSSSDVVGANDNGKQKSLYARLAAPQWEGIALGHEGTGKQPSTYFDEIAESFLDGAIPRKERLFAGSAPFLENLL